MKNYYLSLAKPSIVPNTDFLDFPATKNISPPAKELTPFLREKRFFVHIGIGGSSLGAKLLIEALGPKRNGIRFIFMDNIDPDTIHHQLEEIDLKEAIFFAVSKSGNTLETMAILSVVEQILQDKGIDLPSCFAVATDPASNPLADWADKFNIPRLAIPPEVGGRYSVLSPVRPFSGPFCWHCRTPPFGRSEGNGKAPFVPSPHQPPIEGGVEPMGS